MLIPAALTGLALATDLPATIGGYKAYQPAFYETKIFIATDTHRITVQASLQDVSELAAAL